MTPVEDETDVEISCAGCGRRTIVHGGNLDSIEPGWSWVQFTETSPETGYTRTATLWGCPEHPQSVSPPDNKE